MIRFKRRAPSKSKYKDSIPVWHILDPRWPTKLHGPDSPHYLLALCGFKYNDIFMDATISKAKVRPPTGPHCKRCKKEYEKLPESTGIAES